MSADFRFRNTSDKPVEIAGLTTSCGCLLAEIEKTRYAAGESGIVTAIYRVGTASGLQTHTITVTTKENPETRYELTLQVDFPRGGSTGVPPATPVKPVKLLWTRPPFAPKNVTVDLANAAAGEDVKVTCDREGFQFEVRKQPEKREATIVVTPLASAPSGQTEMIVSWQNRDGGLEEHPVTLHILAGRAP